MNLVARWSRSRASVVATGVLAVGLLLPGCGEAPSPERDPSQPEATGPASQPLATEPPAEPAPGPDTTEPAPGPDTTEPAPGPDTTEPAPGPDTTEPAPGPDTTGPPPMSVDVSATPEVSQFAPAEDLVSQVDYYLERLVEAVESEQAYTDFLDRIAKDSNTLIVIALALGLHDQDHKYKESAGLMMKQAQELAAAADYAAAKRGVEALEATAAGLSSPQVTGLKWEPVASLEQLMKQVPLINTRLKRYMRGSRFRSKAEETAGCSAVIAVIAQGTIADTHEAENETQVEQWKAFSVQMREAAGAVNAAIHAQDQAAADAAMERLNQSCDDCHAVFHVVEEE